jgi:ABC-type Fe3+/spermidine/putrescine transport system ATPase subunit
MVAPASEDASGKLSLAVRPEKVQIVANGVRLDNQFAGSVESVAFLGGSILYRVAIADRLVLAVAPNDGAQPLHAPGESVTLGWAARDAVLLRE